MIIRPKLPPYQRPKTINRTSKKQKMISQTILKDLPSGTELLENQVAGHTFQIGTDEIGKCISFVNTIFYFNLVKSKIIEFYAKKLFKFPFNAFNILFSYFQACSKINRMVLY